MRYLGPLPSPLLPFEELTAYLAQVTDRTTVSRLAGISWRAGGSIVERVVARRLDAGRFDELTRIGIDEFSYRKRHHYLTVVVDHDRRRVVWAGEGRSAQTLHAFFDRLGPDGCARIALVTADLAASYQQAVRARVPKARVVFDRFHVERLATDALDEVRRTEQRGLAPGPAKALKGMRYPLLKHPARLKPVGARRLATLRRENRALDRAYELKEYLATILEQAPAAEAPALLDEWVGWAARSRLRPFIRVARTIRKHAAGILIETPDADSQPMPLSPGLLCRGPPLGDDDRGARSVEVQSRDRQQRIHPAPRPKATVRPRAVAALAGARP